VITTKIKAILKNNNIEHKTETTAYLNTDGDTLYYVESDSEKTVVEVDFINKILRRDNKKLFLEYRFDLDKETESIIVDKELDQTLTILIKTNKFEITEKDIIIEYEIEGDNFIYSLRKED